MLNHCFHRKSSGFQAFACFLKLWSAKTFETPAQQLTASGMTTEMKAITATLPYFVDTRYFKLGRLYTSMILQTTSTDN
jgi:hypothetical protein